MIDRTRKMKIKPKNEPLKPMARRRSKKKMQMNIKPTSFVTNIPRNEQVEEVSQIVVES